MSLWLAPCWWRVGLRVSFTESLPGWPGHGLMAHVPRFYGVHMMGRTVPY